MTKVQNFLSWGPHQNSASPCVQSCFFLLPSLGSDPKGVPCGCSAAKSCSTLCDPMTCSPPGFSVYHYLPEFAQIHIHWISDVIQPSHPLSPPSPLALNFSQHQGLSQWVGSLHQVAKVLFELQQQSFQCIFNRSLKNKKKIRFKFKNWSIWDFPESQLKLIKKSLK